MRVNKRSYYRNWYQHWKQQEEEKALEQAMKYFAQPQEFSPQAVEENPYKANHDLNRQYAGAPRSSSARSGYAPPEQASRQQTYTTTTDMPRRKKDTTGADALRGLLLGLPVVVVLLALLYAFDVISQDSINAWLGGGGASPQVLEVVNQHDELIQLHNEVNQSIMNNLRAETITPMFLQQIQGKQEEITKLTEELNQSADSSFSDINRLLALQLLSLNGMVSQIVSHDEVTVEVLESFNQFVSDQNEIGNQMNTALGNFLDKHQIQYTKQANGSLEIR